MSCIIANAYFHCVKKEERFQSDTQRLVLMIAMLVDFAITAVIFALLTPINSNYVFLGAAYGVIPLAYYGCMIHSIPARCPHCDHNLRERLVPDPSAI